MSAPGMKDGIANNSAVILRFWHRHGRHRVQKTAYRAVASVKVWSNEH